MPYISVHGIVVFFCNGYGNAALFCVFDFFFTRFNIPYSPGSDYFHLRCESFYCELETNLVVSFARAAVAYCRGTFRFGYFNKTLCDAGTCVRCAEHVFAFVNRAGFQRRPDVISYVFLLKIFYIKFGGACLKSLFLETVRLFALTYVTAYGYNFAVIIFLKPRNDY